MKNHIVIILCALFCAHSVTLIAQSQDKIIKVKVMSADDKNAEEQEGNVIYIDENQGPLEMNAADFLEMEAGEGDDKNVSINVSSEIVNGKEVRTVSVSIFEGKHARMIEWQDDGKNIPADIQAQLDEEGIDLNIEGEEKSSGEKEVSVEVEVEKEDGEKKRTVVINIQEDGKEKVLEWEDNGEVPENIRKKLESEGIDINIIEGGEDGVQETEDIIIKKDGNKEVIIEKKSMGMIDDNDAGEKKIIEWSGEGEVPEDVKKMLKEEGIELSNFTVEEIEDEHESKKMKVKMMKGEGGQIIEWNGEGDMPEDVQKILEEEGIDIEDLMNKGENGGKKVIMIKKEISEDQGRNAGDVKQKRVKIKVKDEDGKEKVIEWDGEGEMPEEMQKVLEEYGGEIRKNNKKQNKDHGYLQRGRDFFLDKNPILGVVLTAADTDKIFIDEVLKNTAAQKMGLMSGDQITHINEQNISSIEQLQQTIREHEVGDVIQVTYIRNDQKLSGDATLEAEAPKQLGCCSTQNMSFCKNTMKEKTYLGVVISETEKGVRVNEVIENSPAEKAGLLLNDIIVQIDAYEVYSTKGLQNKISSYQESKSVKVTYIRDGKESVASAVLGKYGARTTEKKVKKAMYQCGDQFSGDPDIDILFQKLEDNPREHKVVILREVQKSQLERSSSEELEKPNPIPPSRSLSLSFHNVFPNPVDDMVTLQFEGEATPTIIQMIDIKGQQVYKETMNDFRGSYNDNIDVASLPAGSYFIHIIQNQKIHTHNLIVQ